MTETELRAAITARVLETIRFYNDLLPKTPINPDTVTIRFTLRGGTAGSARWTNYLNFNLILANTDPSHFLARTVPHEVAHLFQTAIDPLAPAHGKLWKRLMRMGGFETTRTHNYDTSVLNRKVFRYGCNCSTPHNLSTRKHNKIIAGAAYRCTVCKSLLSPLDS